jgi:hypothetical protein
MSSKQLARTVIDGRQLTFTPLVGNPITGYLCGMDDFHWMVVTATGTKHLVHKASAPVIDFSDLATYQDEPLRDSLDGVVGPFRRFVEAEFFGRATAPASTERASA